jgi:hypothetical protein
VEKFTKAMQEYQRDPHQEPEDDQEAKKVSAAQIADGGLYYATLK